MTKKTVEQPTEFNISTMKGQITKAQNKSAQLIIKTDDEQQEAVQLLTIVKSNAKKIKDEKKKFLDPINALVKQTRDFFRPVELQMAQAESDIKSQLSAYENEKQAQIEAEEAKLAERMKTEEMKPSEVVAEMDEITDVNRGPIRAKRGSASYRTVQDMKIVDRNLVPHEYWVIDEVALRRDAITRFKATGEQIAGVVVTERKDVSVRL